jgi:hypothetical protein
MSWGRSSLRRGWGYGWRVAGRLLDLGNVGKDSAQEFGNSRESLASRILDRDNDENYDDHDLSDIAKRILKCKRNRRTGLFARDISREEWTKPQGLIMEPM